MLPQPSVEALAHSQKVTAHIVEKIRAAGGWINFADYMRAALYAPGLGYYSAGARKFGSGGDFVTAPEISPLFGRCLARACRPVLAEGGAILEFGAGSGVLAADILAELATLDCLPQTYFILDLSPDLRERQARTLQSRVPELAARVRWLDALPESFAGVVLANEVLDAMPVRLFLNHEDAPEELGVSVAEEGLVLAARPAPADLQKTVSALDLPPGYRSEINDHPGPWLKALGDSLERGLVLLIDYGFPRREYYHPQRSTGTLMCHYRHYAHTDPLFLPGLQDITAHVDFTAVAEAALAAGFHVGGYTSQADFLLACGLDTLLQQTDPGDLAAYLPLVQGAKKLIMPEEMGELFKVMTLTRGSGIPLAGFARDRRGSL